MRLLVRSFLLLLVLAPIVLIALVWFSLSAQPAVSGPPLSYRDIERAQLILKREDPRSLVPGTQRRVSLDERDLNLALNYLVRKYARGGMRVTLEQDRMRIAATANLLLIPSRPYANIVATIESADDAPRLAALRIGAVTVPPPVAGWLARQAIAQLDSVAVYVEAIDAIERVAVHPGRLTVVYRWRPDTLRAAGARLAGTDDARLGFYLDRLLALQQTGDAPRGSAVPTLRALFQAAQARSATGDPVAENRAALLILGAWASERGVRNLLPQAPREPRPFDLSLQQRRDWAQHFLVSAALAASGDTTLARAAGIFKEVSDSRGGGSGFSFGDLAADRAGTRFGELATASRENALRVQRFLTGSFSERDLMPDAGDLPENLPEPEFRRCFGGVDGPGYRRALAEIDRRVSVCPLYRD